RFLGVTAVGGTKALHQVIDAGAFDSAQVVCNMLNPSAASELPPNYPAQDYEADVERARRVMPLVKEEFAASLTEAATRFAISHAAIGTILVGIATPQQFDEALAAVQKGPLPAPALELHAKLVQNFSGE